mmetsp:Transcript_12151/g.36105  ORF Transcript_12151/g.36105 Transcript_12151/m.36105 type:complete len:107 (-) Transcript_12151:47-367(-)
MRWRRANSSGVRGAGANAGADGMRPDAASDAAATAVVMASTRMVDFFPASIRLERRGAAVILESFVLVAVWKCPRLYRVAGSQAHQTRRVGSSAAQHSLCVFQKSE